MKQTARIISIHAADTSSVIKMIYSGNSDSGVELAWE